MSGAIRHSSVKKIGRPPDELRQQQRRDEILDAAASLFAEKGFDRADTQALADLLGVGKGTIYRYFPSKRELFLAAVDRCIHRLGQAVDQSITTVADPLGQLAAAVHAYLKFFQENPACVELLIQERAQFRDRPKSTYFQHQEARIDRWHQRMRDLIAAGRVRAIGAERITEVISELVYGAMFTNYFAGQRVPLEQQAQNIFDIVMRGILSDSERAKFSPSETCPNTT